MKEQIKYVTDELITLGNLNAIDVAFSTDYIAHSGEKKYEGHDFLKRWTRQIHSAIHDIKVRNVEFLSQDNKTITWQRTISGIHKAPLQRIPPTDKKVTWNEMVVSRFKDDKIIEEWVVSDLAGELLLKQPKKSK